MLTAGLDAKSSRAAVRGIAHPWAVAALAVVLAIGVVATPLAQVRGTYLYTLSNFDGRLPYSWVRVHLDDDRDETFVVYQNLVRIFNATGMEVFSFGEDLDLGQIVDVAAVDNGDLLVLSYKDARPLVTRCDFRGIPIGPVEITGVPAGVNFGGNRMIHRNGLLYFASMPTLSVVVTDASGAFREHLDFRPLLEADEKQLSGAEMFGFSVDREGQIYFTVPVLFKAFRRSVDGQLVSFGRPGSTAGRFGVVAGISADSRGNVLVADKLRSVVMVFDKDLGFVSEFGGRNGRPGDLVVPDDIAIDGRDRVYVTQGARRGVSVFALSSD